MKKYLNKYKKIIITLCFPYIYLMFVLVTPTNYSLYAPGDLNTLKQNIEIEEVELLDDFYTVSIYHITPITAFQKFTLIFNPEFYIYERTQREKETNKSDDYLQGELAKYVSLKTSVIKAYEYANLKNNAIEISYEFKGLYIYSRPNKESQLRIGDVITKIDGKSYIDYDEEAFRSFISEQGNTYTILRKSGSSEEEIDIEYQFSLGDLPIYYLGNYAIIEAIPRITIKDQNFQSHGQSGGLIQTLNIYASLLNINIDGLRIAGTGTINMDGSIGKIGGATQKIYAAITHKADVFFIPLSNYNEIKDINVPYELIVVSTIEEAVNWLYEGFN